MWRNESDRAIEMMQSAVERARAENDLGMEAFILGQLGFCLNQAGRTEEAISAGERALLVARAIGAPTLIASQLFLLGLAYGSVDPTRALTLVEESFALIDVDHTVNVEWNWLALAQVQIQVGRHGDALASCRSALANVRHFGANFALPSTLEAAARALFELGDCDRAVKLLASAETIRTELGTEGTRGDVRARQRILAQLRDAVDPDAFDAASAEGRAVGVDQAVALLAV